jgi:hypothetical protein
LSVARRLSTGARRSSSGVRPIREKDVLAAQLPGVSEPVEKAHSSFERVRPARRQGGDQFLIVYKPQLDRSILAAADQPSIRQRCRGRDRAAVREHHRLANTLLEPQLDLAVADGASQPSICQCCHGDDLSAGNERQRFARPVPGPQLNLAIVAGAGADFFVAQPRTGPDCRARGTRARPYRP